MEILKPKPATKREPLVIPPDSGNIRAKGKPPTQQKPKDPITRYTQAFFNDDGTPRQEGPPLDVEMEDMTFG